MASRGGKPERIVTVLRQNEVSIANGKTPAKLTVRQRKDAGPGNSHP